MDPQSAAKIGRLLGVKYIVTGGVDKVAVNKTGAALSTALYEAREGTDATILPFYFGDDRYTHISDAFLPATLVILVGLLTASAARAVRDVGRGTRDAEGDDQQ